MAFSWKIATIAMTVLLSTGCSTLPTPLEHANGVASTAIAPRPYYQAIDVSGRLSVRYEQNGKEQAMHGSFTWRQTAELTVVTLLSPLGQTLATINITPTQSTLHQAGQPLRSATDVDQLTTQALGWPLPIAGLREWLQAFGTDNQGQRFNLMPTSDSSVATSVTTADQWLIQYTNWQTPEGANNTNNTSYPKRIDLSRNTQQAGLVSIRIVVDSSQPR